MAQSNLGFELDNLDDKPGNAVIPSQFDSSVVQVTEPVGKQVVQVTEPEDSDDVDDVEEKAKTNKKKQNPVVAWFSTPVGAFTLRFGFFLLYLAYFFYCILRCVIGDCQPDEGWWTLLTLTCVAFGIIILYAFIRFAWPSIWKKLRKYKHYVTDIPFLKWIIYGAIVIAYLLFVIIDVAVTRQEPDSLISLAGVVTILLLCFAGSHAHRHIVLRPVVIGLGLQFVFALIVLRWDIGQFIFAWLGNLVEEFLSNANEGALFVWRSAFTSGDFAFSVLPIIPFFAAFTAVLYYLGWIQAVIKVLASALEKLMGTTAGESTTCSANVFLGMTEAPLLIRPFLPHMTKSELHAVMTGGFATIAGSVMGAFIALGVDSRHLLAASLMSAPCALALSKLVYPETRQTSLRAADVERHTKADKESQPRNIIEAACEGASASIPLVANIVVNLIAIISLLSLIDSLLIWFGDRAGLVAPDVIEEPGLTLEFIASYVFWPVAYLIGVPFDDCRSAGKLLGLKVFVNEFVAFDTMSVMIENRKNYTSYYCEYVFNTGDDTLAPVPLNNGTYYLPATNDYVGTFMSLKAESIATYALCGFANIAAMGIQIGGIGTLAAEKRPILSQLAFRSMLTGNAVNLLNAATAGLLISTAQTMNETCSAV